MRKGRNSRMIAIAAKLSALVSLLIVLTVFAIVAGRNSVRTSGNPVSAGQQFAPVSRRVLEHIYHQVWQVVNDNYLERSRLAGWKRWEHRYDGKLRTDRQLANAIREMVASLGDRESVYLTARQERNLEFAREGKTIGVGIQFSGTVIQAVIPDSPADRAGLKAREAIVSVDGTGVSGFPSYRLAQLLHGKEGSKVVLGIVGYSPPVIRQVTIVRGPFSVDTGMSFSLGDRATGGSIIIRNLRSDALLTQLDAAIDALNQSEIPGIVLDLRGVTGGSGVTAVRVAARFLSHGAITTCNQRSDGKRETTTYCVSNNAILVSTRVAGAQAERTTIKGPVNRYRGTVVVLVDGNTAGAAELIAAALKENGRAIVTGVTTAGKGTGQTPFFFPRGHVIRLTNTRYVTPQHNPIERRGVAPSADLDLRGLSPLGMTEKARSCLIEHLPRLIEPQTVDPGSDGGQPTGKPKGEDPRKP